MNRSLYFIPLIERALEQVNPRKALIDVFREIISLGKDPGYSSGFSMFSSFMAEVAENWKLQSHLSSKTETNEIEDISLQVFVEALAKSPFDLEAEADLADWSPAFLKYLEQRIRTLSPIDAKQPIMELDVIRDGEMVLTIPLDPNKPFHRISDIQPGKFTIALGSGRVLWEVTLEKKDLILMAADPEKNIRLAADTGEKNQHTPSREMVVLDGELVFRVYAGLENGWIEIDTRNL